jgi:3-hydroxybutyryl-CoA dehydrogenase
MGIVGSGAIACGIAAVAARSERSAVLWARSESSADRARSHLEKLCERLEEDVSLDGVDIVTDRSAVHDCSYVIETIAEDLDAKAELLADLHEEVGADTILASTTSSLPIERLAELTGRPERFVGFHVFNPVTKMKLVELAFPVEASADTRARTYAVCDAFDKTAVEVPTSPGFVVNRLLFPYLFSAVRLLEETGMDAADIDRCMQLGAGHPMGPLALLDLVGLDVARAIGETIDAAVPARVMELVDAGQLGRKTGRGFHVYD